MKFVFVNVRVDDRRLPPLGIAYIAAYLRKREIDVSIIDPTPKQLPVFDYIKEIVKQKPDVIGFFTTGVNMKKVKEVQRLLKKENINAPIVLGGPQVTVSPNDFDFDYAVIGEGEITAYELTKVLKGSLKKEEVNGLAYYENKKLIINKPRKLIKDLDILPLPARNLFNLNWYFQNDSIIRGTWGRGTSVLWSRGCPYNCLFCVSRNVFGRSMRLRSPKLIVDEIQQLKKKYGIKIFYVLDDILNINQEWTNEICNELIRRKLNIKWSCQIRVDRVNPEILKKMKEAGCLELEFGCESGSQKVLNAIRKGTTVFQIEEAFQMARQAGIKTLAYFMIGNPEEDYEDIKKTIELAKKIKADYYEFSISTPYPGSDLWKLAKKNGWLKDGSYSSAFHSGDRALPIMEINFKIDELLKIKAYLLNQFRNRYLAQFLSQPLFVWDLIKVLILSPLTTLKIIKNVLKRDIVAAAWCFFHQQRLWE